MLKLPVTDDTFRKGFLGGRGELAVTPSPSLSTALSPTAPFPDGVGQLIAQKGAGAAPELTFGSPAVRCTANFGAESGLQLTLVRTSDASGLPPGASPPAEDRLGVLLKIEARANVAAGAAVGAPAGFSFGLSAKAGAQVALQRYLEFRKDTPARGILEAVFADVRLPHSRGVVADLPQPGEVVVFCYDGFLELAAALNWGYSLTGSESFEIRDIDTRLKYALRAKARVGLNYRLAGEYSIGLRRGHADGWARLTVRKRDDARFQASAGFDFTGRADLAGLPDTPNEFLAAFLGADVKSVLETLDQAVAATDIDELEKRAGKLLSGLLAELSERWTGGPLDSSQLGVVLGGVRKAIEAYKSVDVRVVQTVVELYEKAVGAQKSRLEDTLRSVSTLSTPQDLAAITDQDAWSVIQQIVGGDIFRLASAESLAIFGELRAVASSALRMLVAPDFEPLRDLIDAARARLKIDDLFGQLEPLSSAKDLRQLRDKTLQGLVERIVGRAFDEIEAREFAAVAREVNGALAQLQTFKNAFAEKMEKALHQSVELRINALYTRARADSTLVDVEIDVRTPPGEALFQEALSGRMRPMLDAARRASGIIVHDALLTHELTRASQLQINAFGWQHKRLVELVTKTEISLQAHSGGLVQVFTTAATLKQIEESGRKHKERMQTNFLLRMTGETFGAFADAENREYLVRTFERMSVDYDLLQSDDMTDVDELTEYVSLGGLLGLVPDGTIALLRSQFGRRLGKVKASYKVRFHHTAVHDAFVALSGERLESVVRSAARRLVAAAFVRRKSRSLAAVGLAYRDGAALLQKHRANLLDKQSITVSLPAWLADGGGKRVSIDLQGRELLRTLFSIEESLAARFVALDLLIDDARRRQRAVAVAELEKAVEEVLACGAQMDAIGGPNSFFGVFDALVRIGGLGKAHRESVFVLELTPPGGDTVTKFFMDSEPGAGPAGMTPA
ncbi:MAG: hypothetical protein AB7Q29_12135 [Vicinamibacterales bacterium]